MKDKILEITEDEAVNLLLGLIFVKSNGIPFNIQDFMEYYHFESDFVFTSSISDVVIGMLNK